MLQEKHPQFQDFGKGERTNLKNLIKPFTDDENLHKNLFPVLGGLDETILTFGAKSGKGYFPPRN
jgi:hypothetical protein